MSGSNDPPPPTAHLARRDARWLPSQPRSPYDCQAHAQSFRATALQQYHARLLHEPLGHRHVLLPADPTPLLHGPLGHRHVLLPADPTPLLHEPLGHRHVLLPADPTPLLLGPLGHRHVLLPAEATRLHPKATLLLHRVLPRRPRVEVPLQDHQVRQEAAVRIRADRELSRKQE